jgi:hypothetical protein
MGNSTAEMLMQLHRYEDSGVPVSYRVLTHHSEETLRDPGLFFRQTTKNLVRFQGDIEQSRMDLERALEKGRITCDVKKWSANKRQIRAYNSAGECVLDQEQDQLFTLIGYEHNQESLAKMDCSWDPNFCGIPIDFDGEVLADPANSSPVERIKQGYFVFGANAINEYNPNAGVIPGMIFSIGDLLFGITMRAVQHKQGL